MTHRGLETTVGTNRPRTIVGDSRRGDGTTDGRVKMGTMKTFTVQLKGYLLGSRYPSSKPISGVERGSRYPPGLTTYGLVSWCTDVVRLTNDAPPVH